MVYHLRFIESVYMFAVNYLVYTFCADGKEFRVAGCGG
jgi:hypothetical protein